jgi:formylglycine-generating enzyme required for sulfatase activity
MSAHPRLISRNIVALSEKLPPRFIPFLIAGIICVATAILIGGGAWYLIASHVPVGPERGVATVLAPSPSPAQPPAAAPAELAPAVMPLALPKGTVEVPGGTITLGLPPRKVVLDSFAIAETEVTNEQYREFVKETGHSAPKGWTNGEFPAGTANHPVTDVTWQDAADYCAWLSTRIGATVRLPSEVEWELAARGKELFKYPWGNEWNEQAVDFTAGSRQGQVRDVKSFEAGKSPVGAYDMAGNVWEWVDDDARDQDGKPRFENGVAWKIIKGGSAGETPDRISATARDEVLAVFADRMLGFRYVVVTGSHAEP